VRHFAESFILPIIDANRYRRICEIGANEGENTEILLGRPNLSLTVIDPFPGKQLLNMCDRSERLNLKLGLSLEVLNEFTEPFDCFLIDGDHNWYTVYHELKTIRDRKLLTEGGTIFFHDVAWPYGRRDMYYAPESIPASYRKAYQQAGIERGKSALSPDSDFNREHWNAVSEGGEKNGVLTAIEDFIDECPGEFRFTFVREEYGLGILTTRVGYQIMPHLLLLVKSKYVALSAGTRSAIRNNLPVLYRTLAKARSNFRRGLKHY